MKIAYTLQTSCYAMALLALVGCGTTMAGSRDQMESTVYDTHRRVVNLDTQLGDTLTKLNETTAELIQRVNDSDQTTRRLLSLVEENQRKIDGLQKDVTDVKKVIYQQFNLTLPSSGYAAPTSQGVTILPPETTAAPAGDADMGAMEEMSAPDAPVSAPAAPAAAGDPEEHYKAAQRDYANERYTEALAAFQEHLQMWPSGETSANALFWKGKCHLKLGQYNDAITDFERLAKEYPTNTKVPFAMHNEAVAYSNLNQPAEAERLLSSVIANYPVSPAAEQARMDLEKLKGR